jgi:hypothetical protein
VSGQWVGKLVELAAEDEGVAAHGRMSGGDDVERGIGAGGRSFGGGIALDSDMDSGWGSPLPSSPELREDADARNTYPPAAAPGHM